MHIMCRKKILLRYSMKISSLRKFCRSKYLNNYYNSTSFPGSLSPHPQERERGERETLGTRLIIIQIFTRTELSQIWYFHAMSYQCFSPTCDDNFNGIECLFKCKSPDCKHELWLEYYAVFFLFASLSITEFLWLQVPLYKLPCKG